MGLLHLGKVIAQVVRVFDVDIDFFARPHVVEFPPPVLVGDVTIAEKASAMVVGDPRSLNWLSLFVLDDTANPRPLDQPELVLVRNDDFVNSRVGLETDEFFAVFLFGSPQAEDLQLLGEQHGGESLFIGLVIAIRLEVFIGPNAGMDRSICQRIARRVDDLHTHVSLGRELLTSSATTRPGCADRLRCFFREFGLGRSSLRGIDLRRPLLCAGVAAVD